MAESIALYYGKSEYLLNQVVTERLEALGVDPFHVARYDLLEDRIDDAYADVLTIPFFEQKVVVIDNFDVITNEAKSTIAQWVEYFEKPNPDVTLILLMKQRMKKNTVLGKTLERIAHIEEVQELDHASFLSFTTKLFDKEGFRIDRRAAELLLERTNHDFDAIIQEAKKLMLFSADERVVTEDMVGELVSRNLEEHIYELTNAFLSQDQARSIAIFADLIARNEDPIRIMASITNRIRTLFQTKILLSKGYRKEEISRYFGISSGRAYYMIRDATGMSLSDLKEQLEKLSELDYHIKSGRVDKRLGVELYLLGA
ncbi:MAG: DNA polymerase III subunit delta [Acholeplasmataceae bacterium]